MHLTFGLLCRSENWLVTLQKRDTHIHTQSQCLWEKNNRKHEKSYQIYFITNFKANILTDKLLYSDFSFERKTENHGW